ncbi:MAG TPA: hypothetical protein VHK91_09395 [Flavisolibacter sp.]|nr:hypothetical protein [Flavisolibacter sp.]
MDHLLFAAYLVLFAWLITKIKFFTGSGLNASQLIIVFLLKVMAGIFYGWIGVYYGQMAQMVDTWAYHYESIKEYHLLQTHPADFFSNIFHNSYENGYSNFLISKNSWWNDLKGNFVIKVLAILNLVSFGNYYVNLIFYSFLTLFGPIAIFRVMKDLFPGKQLTILASIILVPSFIYWSSGIHKDGLLFVGLSLITYSVYFSLKENKFTLSRLVSLAIGILLVLALRNFLIVPLIPALLAWILASRLKLRPIIVFLSIYLIFIVLFFTMRYLLPSVDLPNAVVIKQEEFLALSGGSAVTVEKLTPEFTSFLKNTPQAAALSFIRPYPTDVRHLLSLAAAIEINFLIVLFLIFLFWHKRSTKPVSPAVLFFIFFSFSVLMMIGYTVNFLGAIVRYRSIVFPFLLVPMIASINWGALKQLFNNYILKNNNI